MKIDNLIKRLEKEKALHGNVDVQFYVGDSDDVSLRKSHNFKMETMLPLGKLLAGLADEIIGKGKGKSVKSRRRLAIYLE